MQEEKTLHYVLGGALMVIILFVVVSLVMINSQATNTAVSINNVPPTVTSVYLSNTQYLEQKYFDGLGMGNILLEAGTIRTVYITGKVADDNGNGDIDNVSVILYRSSAIEGNDCTADKNYCYKVATCDTRNTDANPLSKDYSCQIDIGYFADATDPGGRYSTDKWKIMVTVTDGIGTGTDNSSEGELDSLLALEIPPAINYGSLGLGAKTINTTNQVIWIYQEGNDEADVEVSSAAAMSCTLGSIPVANQKWSLSDFGYKEVGGWEDVVALDGSATDTNLNVIYQDSDVTATKSALYWNIEIPTGSVGGTCTGTTTITAIAH